jgi:hypothetical protein
MTFLAPQQIAVTGTTIAYVAASAGGDSASPDDRTFLRVKNGSGASINVTLIVPGSTYGQANPDPVIAVPAAGEVSIDLPPGMADPASGLVSWTYSLATTVTVALVRA